MPLKKEKNMVKAKKGKSKEKWVPPWLVKDEKKSKKKAGKK
jgi:hypothetical protein